jgi:hypothetical protein
MIASDRGGARPAVASRLSAFTQSGPFGISPDRGPGSQHRRAGVFTRPREPLATVPGRDREFPRLGCPRSDCSFGEEAAAVRVSKLNSSGSAFGLATSSEGAAKEPLDPAAGQTLDRAKAALGCLVVFLAEWRSEYGRGHGRRRYPPGLKSRHARLAVDGARRPSVSSSAPWTTYPCFLREGALRVRAATVA